MFNQTKFENELSDRTRRQVRLSYETFLSPDDFRFFKKLLVDGKEVNVSVDLESLHDAHSRGTLDEEFEKLAKKILTP